MMTDTLVDTAEIGAKDFARVESAIRYLETHYTEQPSLTEMSAEARLSPFHFQRLFARWAGVTPSQFLRYLTIEHAKSVLDESEGVLEAALDSGLSGPSRLHDLFVAYEAVTPGEYKTMGAGLSIRFGFHDGPFGEYLLALTDRGICGLTFVAAGDREAARADLQARWPGARLIEDPGHTSATAAQLFARRTGDQKPLRLWLKGTNFQIKVWEALLRLPPGALTTYSAIADAVGRPGAARAVGTAVGGNPIAVLIPCHRVIRATGVMNNGYRWGSARKLALIGWEAARKAG